MNPKLSERLSKVQKDVNKLISYRDMVRSDIKSHTEEIRKLEYEANLCQKASEVFKSWLEDSLKKNVDSISDLVTAGLQHVIHDQSLSFKIRQELKANRLSMKFAIENNGVEGNPMTSFGGGAVMVASLILRIAVMTRMKMSKLLILDESMSALANHYVPSAGSFMRKLSEEMGINILMVTHNPEFLNHAHISYEGRKDSSLHLTKQRVV